MSDTTSPRPQNVYDDPVFFEGYKNLRQKDSGLNGVLEIPAFHALLPKLQGLKVLDLGAGFGDLAFDLVVSSLALHYVDDYAAVVKRVYASLVPGGQFVFSVEHPLCTAQPSGWVLSPEGERLHWPLDNYHYETERQSRWFVENVTKFHRTLQTYVNTLIAAGFRLDHLGEPTPLPHALKERPSLTDALRRPPFLLLAVSKPALN